MINLFGMIWKYSIKPLLTMIGIFCYLFIFIVIVFGPFVVVGLLVDNYSDNFAWLFILCFLILPVPFVLLSKEEGDL